MTLACIDANGQSCVLVSRGDTVVALVTNDVSTEGIQQIMRMMRPSKLAAVSAACHVSARQLIPIAEQIR